MGAGRFLISERMGYPVSQETAAAPPMLLVTSERFADHHTPSGHPERPDRAAVMTAVAERHRNSGGTVVEPGAAERDALTRVHAAEHVDRIASTGGRHVQLDADTHTSPESDIVARLAAGATVAAVDHALDRGGRACAFVRPPGHHAERARAMGFCLFNNVAVGAAHALARGTNRVAIVDYDVHHGNGTQWMFYDDPRVLYVSTHQYPFYPGTGAASDVGTDAGAGFTLNVPLEAGAGDADYDCVFQQAVIPVLDAFRPELILLSAGYDAHTRDPLGGMLVSTAGYTGMTIRLQAAADAHCGGRLVAVTEGGYDLTALETCLTETLRVMSGPTPPPAPTEAGSSERAEAALEVVRLAQAQFWPGL